MECERSCKGDRKKVDGPLAATVERHGAKMWACPSTEKGWCRRLHLVAQTHSLCNNARQSTISIKVIRDYSKSFV